MIPKITTSNKCWSFFFLRTFFFEIEFWWKFKAHLSVFFSSHSPPPTHSLFFASLSLCFSPCSLTPTVDASIHVNVWGAVSAVLSVYVWEMNVNQYHLWSGYMLEPAVSSTFISHAGSHSCSNSPWNPLLFTLSSDQWFVTVALVVWANRIGLETLAFISIQFYQFDQGFSSWFPMTNWISDKARSD